MELTLVGCGFMGSVVTVLMKFLLVTMPISGGAVFSGTGGFLSLQERLTFLESSVPGREKSLFSEASHTTSNSKVNLWSAEELTVGKFGLFGTLLQVIVW